MLIGNLTRDPELRYTPGGKAVCNFDIAMNRKFKGGDGQLQEETTYMRITVWGKSGENCGKYLAKGRPVFVEGRLQVRSWKTDAGETRKATDVVAHDVQFLGAKGDAPEKSGGGAAAQRDGDPDMGQKTDEYDFD